ncbi:MAG: hypothetical protein IJF49_01135 [Clostridia bacterium]|nr:hypothetical protein [Clostridia bacterium]
MYSRSQAARTGEETLRVPEHYSGVAFDRNPVPRQREYCAEGLPPRETPPPPPMPNIPSPSFPPQPHESESAPPPIERKSESGEGVLGSIGREELLLLGIIYILAQRQGEDDTILLLLLLLLRHE